MIVEHEKTQPTYPVLIKHFEMIAEWKLVAAHLLNDRDGSKTKAIESSITMILWTVELK